MKLFTLLITFNLFITLTSNAQAITPAKEKDIKELLVLMGNSSIAEEMANTLVSIVISQEKERYPNLPKNVEYALSQAMYDVVIEHAPELDNKIAPLYDKYYTHKEILELIAFFKTPTGKKYTSVLSPMMQEMVPLTQQWGKKIGPIAAKRAEIELSKYGYK